MISDYAIDGNKIIVRTPYHSSVVETCRSWGGKWERDKGWVLPITRLDAVQQMLGVNLDDQVEIEVGLDDYDDGECRVGWFILATRSSRDRRADIYAELVAGTIPPSGGSAKHPLVRASVDARFRLWVPRDFAESRGYQIVTDPGKPEVVNPLEQFTDAELIAEYERRGFGQ